MRFALDLFVLFPGRNNTSSSGALAGEQKKGSGGELPVGGRETEQETVSALGMAHAVLKRTHAELV